MDSKKFQWSSLNRKKSLNDKSGMMMAEFDLPLLLIPVAIIAIGLVLFVFSKII
jgi:hypothetical protein